MVVFRLPTEQRIGPKLQWSNRRAAPDSAPLATEAASPEPELAWWQRHAQQLGRQLNSLLHGSNAHKNGNKEVAQVADPRILPVML